MWRLKTQVRSWLEVQTSHVWGCKQCPDSMIQSRWPQLSSRTHGPGRSHPSLVWAAEPDMGGGGGPAICNETFLPPPLS